METPIKIDDLGVPLFLEIPKLSSKKIDIQGLNLLLVSGREKNCSEILEASIEIIEG